MRSKLSALLLCLCSLVLVVGVTGCAFSTTSTSSTGTKNSDHTAISKEEQYLDESVFPKDKVVDVKITIDENDFQDMLDNASAEEYKEASVDYNGIHFDNIGIRTKGNLSLRSVVQMSDSDRYSFKLSFDEYVNQTLEGISKINLNNNYSDASYMREFLTYELAEQMGLPTPKYSFVNVYVNDELWGFYLAVEQISDAYLERNFGNSYGALYKAEMTGSGNDLAWHGEDPDSYGGLVLKSETTNDDILIDMINELNNGTDYEKYLDVEEALKFIALNVVTNNTDSYIGQTNHNYYLYEDDGVFSVLPWDFNMAFGGLGGGAGMGGFGGKDRTNRTAATATDTNAATTDTNASTNDTSTKASDGSDIPANGEVKQQPVATDQQAVGSNTADKKATAATDAGANDSPKQDDGASVVAQGNTRSGSQLLIDEPTSGAVADRPLVAKLLAVDEYKELYHNIIEEATQGYLSNDTFTARVQEIADMIDAYVKADPSSFYTYDEYTEAVPKLISINASQVENINQQLSGQIASSGDGSGSGGGMGGMGGMMEGMGGGFGGGQQLGNNNGDMQIPQDMQWPDMNGAPPELPDGMQMPPDFQGQNMDGALPELPDGAQMQMPQGGQGVDANGQASTDTQTQQEAANTQAADQNTQGWGGNGAFPGGRGGGGGGGFPGGGMNGFGQGGQGAPTTQDATTEAITVGVAVVVLLLSCVFIQYFKRRRL